MTHGKRRYLFEERAFNHIKKFAQSGLVRKQADYREDNLFLFLAWLDGYMGNDSSMRAALDELDERLAEWIDELEPIIRVNGYAKKMPEDDDHRRSDLRKNSKKSILSP